MLLQIALSSRGIPPLIFEVLLDLDLYAPITRCIRGGIVFGFSGSMR
jgi:hypothetical protein